MYIIYYYNTHGIYMINNDNVLYKIVNHNNTQ